jgi:hypothetical protein
MATRTTSAMDAYRQRMADEGRRPSFDSAGNVRGYRSRPGAPTVGGGGFGVPGMATPGNATPQDAWNSFFHKPAPAPSPQPVTPPASNISLAPETTPDAASMAATTPRPYSQPATDPSDLYSTAAQSHASYLEKSAGGWISTTPFEASRIGQKYGGKTMLTSAKLDNSFDSLLQ